MNAQIFSRVSSKSSRQAILFTRRLSLALSIASLLGLLALTGCGSSEPTAPAPTPEESSPAVPYIQQMSSLVSDMEGAVRDGNYETAKATFADVQSLWKKTADDVRAENEDAYDAIATHLENISNEFADNPPEPKNMLSILNLLKIDLDRAS
ncbi:MAG: hypothetical protein WA947_07575 [Phormidesmis sp.]